MRTTTAIILFLAVLAAIFSLVGGESFKQLGNVTQSLELQRAKNSELRSKVDGLKRDIYGLKRDPRALEKAARNELGVANDDELVVIFKERPGR